MNCKPWEFIVVTDPEKLAQFRSRLIFGNRNAPAAIVVCGNPGLSTNPAARLFWVQDCSAAAENILIAAVGLGLGTVWIGVHPVAQFRQNGARNCVHSQKSDTVMHHLCRLPAG